MMYTKLVGTPTKQIQDELCPPCRRLPSSQQVPERPTLLSRAGTAAVAPACKAPCTAHSGTKRTAAKEAGRTHCICVIVDGKQTTGLVPGVCALDRTFLHDHAFVG